MEYEAIDFELKKIDSFVFFCIEARGSLGSEASDILQTSKFLLHQKSENVRTSVLIDSGLVRSHEERKWLFEEPTQSRITPSILEYTKIKGAMRWAVRTTSLSLVTAVTRENTHFNTEI